MVATSRLELDVGYAKIEGPKSSQTSSGSANRSASTESKNCNHSANRETGSSSATFKTPVKSRITIAAVVCRKQKRRSRSRSMRNVETSIIGGSVHAVHAEKNAWTARNPCKL